MAVDQFHVGGLHFHLCVRLFLLLFLLQNKVSSCVDGGSFHFMGFLLFCRMYGLFQTAFYFGYMALFSGALGIICGTVGYMGTNVFVRKIYSNVKID